MGGTLVLEGQVEAKRPAVQRGILSWAVGHARYYPWREPGRSPYEILIAEVLLKRTTATAAARLYGDFLSRFPRVQDLPSASKAELEAILSSVGLQKQRARAFLEIGQHIVANEGGVVPKTPEGLLRVPHLGPYSAGAVLSFGYGLPAPVVDSNVARILTRLFLHSMPARPGQGVLWAAATALVPEQGHREYNLGMLDLGALVCRYVRPRCDECPLLAVCDSRTLAGPSTD